MVVARHQFAELIARAFDGAVVVDGVRVVAHKSGTHCVRLPNKPPDTRPRTCVEPLDPDNDWSAV